MESMSCVSTAGCGEGLADLDLQGRNGEETMVFFLSIRLWYDLHHARGILYAVPISWLQLYARFF